MSFAAVTNQVTYNVKPASPQLHLCVGGWWLQIL